MTRRRLIIASILALAVLLAGVLIKPAGAHYRFANYENSAMEPNFLPLRTGISRLRQYSFWEDFLAVSYTIEGPGRWSEGDVSGCNDAWTITSYTIYGIRLNRAQILCDGVDMRAA